MTGAAEKVETIADFSGDVAGVVQSAGGGDDRAALALVSELAASRRFSMPVSAAFPLEAISDAHRASERGHVIGSYVVAVA